MERGNFVLAAENSEGYGSENRRAKARHYEIQER
jgi:hypothetical protein